MKFSVSKACSTETPMPFAVLRDDGETIYTGFIFTPDAGVTHVDIPEGGCTILGVLPVAKQQAPQ